MTKLRLSILATAPGFLLVLATALSIGTHTAVWISVKDKNLGRLHAQVKPIAQTLHVRVIEDDLSHFLDPQTTAPINQTTSPDAASIESPSQTSQLSLQQLTEKDRFTDQLELAQAAAEVIDQVSSVENKSIDLDLKPLDTITEGALQDDLEQELNQLTESQSNVQTDSTLSNLPDQNQISQINQDLLHSLEQTDIQGLAFNQPTPTDSTYIQLPETGSGGQLQQQNTQAADQLASDILETEFNPQNHANSDAQTNDQSTDQLTTQDLPSQLNKQNLVTQIPIFPEEPWADLTGNLNDLSRLDALTDLGNNLPPLPTDSTDLTQSDLLSPLDALAEQNLIPPIQLDDAFDYHVRQYIPNQTASNWVSDNGVSGNGISGNKLANQHNPNRPYFSVRIVPRPQELQVLDPMPKDVVYLLDTSSSVAKSVVRATFEGVGRALTTLNPGDRFNIAVFTNSTEFFSESGLVDSTPANISLAKSFLNQIQPGGSHTDVNRALKALLARSLRDPSRVLNVVIITDGKPTQGEQDSRQIINQITQDNDRIASVYCLGITKRPNEFLLNYLAYRNGGRSEFVERTQNLPDAIATLSHQLRYPLIRDVSLSVLGSGADDVHPIQLPDIYRGQPFDIYGRFTQPGPFTIHITGSGLKNGRVQPVDFTFVRDLRTSPQGNPTIAQAWAFWKLHHLYSEEIRLGELPELDTQIKALKRIQE